MPSVPDGVEMDEEAFRERLAELARSDRDSAPIYRAYYENQFGEEVPHGGR